MTPEQAILAAKDLQANALMPAHGAFLNLKSSLV